jgi:nitrile hydratase beta subunit-like protein
MDRVALGEEIKNTQAAGDPDTGETYYRHWLAALERIVAEKGVPTAQALAITTRDCAAGRAPHGKPIELRAGSLKGNRPHHITELANWLSTMVEQPMPAARSGQFGLELVDHAAKPGILSHKVGNFPLVGANFRQGEVELHANLTLRSPLHLARQRFIAVWNVQLKPVGDGSGVGQSQSRAGDRNITDDTIEGGIAGVEDETSPKQASPSWVGASFAHGNNLIRVGQVGQFN